MGVCNMSVCVCVGFVICGCVYVRVWWVSVCVGLQYVGVLMCECFGNMCPCIYCVLYCFYSAFVSFRLCIFILICFVCTGVRTTSTE